MRQMMTAAVVMENVNWDPGKCDTRGKRRHDVLDNSGDEDGRAASKVISRVIDYRHDSMAYRNGGGGARMTGVTTSIELL